MFGIGRCLFHGLGLQLSNQEVARSRALPLLSAVFISSASFSAKSGTPITMEFIVVVHECVQLAGQRGICAQRAVEAGPEEKVPQDDEVLRIVSRYTDSIELFPGIPRKRAASGDEGEFMWHVEPGFPERGRLLVNLQYEFSLSGNSAGSTSKATTSTLLTLDGEAVNVGQSITTTISDGQRRTRVETSYISAKIDGQLAESSH